MPPPPYGSHSTSGSAISRTASMPPCSKALQRRRTSSTLSPIRGPSYPVAAASDVVHRRAGFLRLALRYVRDRRTAELRAHLFGDLRPRRTEALCTLPDLALEQLDYLQH